MCIYMYFSPKSMPPFPNVAFFLLVAFLLFNRHNQGVMGEVFKSIVFVENQFNFMRMHVPAQIPKYDANESRTD